MRYIALLPVVIVQFSAQAQETYKKSFLLADAFSSTHKVKLQENRVISRSSLTLPLTEPSRTTPEFVTASSTIKVLSGNVTTTASDITIAKGAELEEKMLTPLLKVTPVKYKDLTAIQKGKLEAKYPLGSVVNYTTERKLPAGKVTAEEKVTVNPAFWDKLTLDSVTTVAEAPAHRGYVKFDEDKVWVSPELVGYTDPGLHYYQLKNRHTIRLWTTDVSISALTMPVKYRFDGKRSNGKALGEEYAAGVNVNVFAGPSIGKTSFHYREKVGNISNAWKVTFGVIAGGSTVTLTQSNTGSADVPLAEDVEIMKGLLSLGVGATFSYNKATIGAFLGKDYSLGKDADRWDYNRKPWLGIAIGYSIFSI